MLNPFIYTGIFHTLPSPLSICHGKRITKRKEEKDGLCTEDGLAREGIRTGISGYNPRGGSNGLDVDKGIHYTHWAEGIKTASCGERGGRGLIPQPDCGDG